MAREEELAEAERQLAELGRRWRTGGLTDGFFFANARALEQDIVQLKRERRHHEARPDVCPVTSRTSPTGYASEFDLSQKPTYIREAVHAVIVHPSGGGRRPCNPDLLEMIWRE